MKKKINRQMNSQQIDDLYGTIHKKNLTDEEMYRYLTKNDHDIVEFKQQVLKIVQQKGLGSYMNDSKWLTLQKEINKLEFTPAYLEKLVTDDEFRYKDVDTSKVSFIGDWSPYYMEGMPLFFTIEYMVIIPRYVKHLGRLIKGKTLDVSDDVKEILIKCNIPFEIENNNIVVFGYR